MAQNVSKMKFQINYIYYYDLPGQHGMMCEREKVDGNLYDSKEIADEMAKDYNKTKSRFSSGKYIAKPVSNGK